MPKLSDAAIRLQEQGALLQLIEGSEQVRVQVMVKMPDSRFIKDSKYLVTVALYEEFPAIFRLIKWWENKAWEDMPEYVEKVTEKDGYHRLGDRMMVTEWYLIAFAEVNKSTASKGFKSRWVCSCNGHFYNAEQIIPSTIEDYQEFKARK